MKLTFSVQCLKSVLIIVNVLFGVFGAFLLSLGIYTLTRGNESVTERVEDELDELYTIPFNFGLVDANPVPAGGAQVDVETTLRGTAVFLIIIGTLLFFTAVVGGIGVCYNNGCLVTSYAIFLLVIFIIQLVTVGLAYFGVLDDRAKELLKEKLEEDYIAVDSYDGFSLTWNLVMSQLECCGVENYTDFNEAQMWENMREFNWSAGVVELTTPLACCKFDDNFSPLELDCAVNPTDANSNWQTGCFEALKDDAKDNEKVMFGVIGGILGFQLILIAASFYIICESEEEKELDF